MTRSVNKILLLSFTNENSPGIHGKYVGLKNAANRNGYLCELYEHTNSIKSYLYVFKRLLKTKKELTWIRYNLEKSPFILLYATILYLKKERLIIEIPTAFSAHLHINNSFWAKFCYYFFAPLVFLLTDKINIYSKEKGFLKYFNKKQHLVGNGIDIDRIIPKESSNSTREGVNLVVVATLATWHGIDLLIKALAKIKNEVVFKLHVVGDGPEYENLVKLSIDYEINKNVVFHGMIKSEELQFIYNNCNIAVGTLNWKSIDITESSPIKNREYSMAGLPFFYEGYDVDFDKSDVAFRLPGVNLVNEISEFILSVYEKDYLPSPMDCNRFAVKNLTYDKKLGIYVSDIR